MKNLFSGPEGSLAAENSGNGLSPADLGKGLGLACILLVVLSLALAAAYCYTSLSGSRAHLLQLAVLGAAAFGGGFCSARGAGRRGLWHGLALAALLLVLLLLASLTGLTTGGVSWLGLLVKGLVLGLAGGLGGIIGVA